MLDVQCSLMNNDPQTSIGNDPAVTVVISTHNRAHLLGRAIRSVLAQTYPDYELLIVEDASTDNTKEVVAGFQDKRIRYIRHETNRGGPAARNTGIKAACGRYIALLDDDDEWLPAKLEKQVQKFQQAPDTVGLIYSGAELLDKDGNSIRTDIPTLAGDVRDRLLWGSLFGSVSKALVKKECFDKVGVFDETLTSCQDWDMWMRIADIYGFDFVPDILVKIHAHGARISTDLGSLIPGRTRMIEKHINDFRAHPAILVQHLKQIGKLHCINGTWREAARWFAKAAKINRFEWIKVAAWCILELPMVRLYSRSRHFKTFRETR